MRYFFIALFSVFAVILLVAGTRGHRFTKPPFELFPDMDHQAKIKYQAPSDFFADGRGARLPVAHTQPMGYGIPEAPAGAVSVEDATKSHYFTTGQIGDYFGDGMPDLVTVDRAFLGRGKEAYDIFCTVCHGVTGDGKGPITQFSKALPANLQSPDFTNPASPAYRPDGSIFQTITHGKGLMGAYGSNITPNDRWAIIAYIRALQNAGATAGKTSG